MHIAEGVLSAPVLAGGYILAVSGTVVGLRRLDLDQIAKVGVMSAFFFVASLIHVPVGLSSAHLLGTGLIGVLLGWAAFPAILVALILQALLFQYGGLTVLGVNASSMGLAAIVAHYFFGWLCALLPGRRGLAVAAFVCGGLGVALAAVFTALALAMTDEGFAAAAIALLLAHFPVILAEAFVTMFTVGFLARVRPGILTGDMARQAAVPGL